MVGKERKEVDLKFPHEWELEESKTDISSNNDKKLIELPPKEIVVQTALSELW